MMLSDTLAHPATSYGPAALRVQRHLHVRVSEQDCGARGWKPRASSGRGRESGAIKTDTLRLLINLARNGAS